MPASLQQAEIAINAPYFPPKRTLRDLVLTRWIAAHRRILLLRSASAGGSCISTTARRRTVARSRAGDGSFSNVVRSGAIQANRDYAGVRIASEPKAARARDRGAVIAPIASMATVTGMAAGVTPIRRPWS
jgi:hypothetical protein